MQSLIAWYTFIFFFVIFFIVQAGNFYNHYCQRSRDYKKAKKYLQTDVCTNPYIRNSLEGYSLCTQSEETLDKPPLFTAIVDTAEDMHICGNGYCSMLGYNVTNALPQIFLVLCIFVTILLWASGIQIRQNYDASRDKRFSLPFREKED